MLLDRQTRVLFWTSRSIYWFCFVLSGIVAVWIVVVGVISRSQLYPLPWSYVIMMPIIVGIIYGFGWFALRIQTTHLARTLLIAAGAALVSSTAVLLFYAPSDMGLIPRPCTYFGGAPIETESQAILTARTAWYCINPDLEPTDEQSWLKDFVAQPSDGVWQVSQTIPEGYAGGGINIDLTSRDGRLVRIYETQ